MAGVKGRSGRYRPYQTVDVNKMSELSFKTILHILEDESIPLLERGKYALPIVTRRIPDKQEIVSLSVSLSNESASKLIELAEHNILLGNELRQSLEQSKDLSNKASIESVIEAKAEPIGE